MNNKNNKILVTVLIPTSATKFRFSHIKRAVNSIRASSLKKIKIIAIVNGHSYDQEVVGWLKTQDDVIYVYDELPSQANAVLVGRMMVDTPYFSTLDDDDEYLDYATDIKLNTLIENKNYDMVVTNGYYCRNGSNTKMYKNIKSASVDPLRMLYNFNWLHNCNALYRTDRIGEDFFVDPHLNLEWTWLAYKISLAGKKILFLDDTTFRYHDTPMSVSKSEAYMNAHMPLFERMLGMNPPEDVVRLIKGRMSMDWHCRSDRALQAGRYAEAFAAHVRSLLLPGGLRFLPYTWRLIPFVPRKKSPVPPGGVA